MGNLMKKYDRGWASLETGAALLIVMLLIAWGAGIWQDYIQTKDGKLKHVLSATGPVRPALI